MCIFDGGVLANDASLPNIQAALILQKLARGSTGHHSALSHYRIFMVSVYQSLDRKLL